MNMSSVSVTKSNNRASLSGLLDSEPKSQQRRTMGGAATVGGDQLVVGTSKLSNAVGDGSSEIYIRADGKKVRRIKKTIFRGESDGNGTVSNPSQRPGAASSALNDNDTTITSSEVYIRPDGKKVRRIVRTSSVRPGGSSSTVAPTSSSASSLKPQTNNGATSTASGSNGSSGLGSFLNDESARSTSSGKSKPTFRGSATVMGTEQIKDGEVYIRADGKKVRRVKKSSSSSIAPAPVSDKNSVVSSNYITYNSSNNSVATTITNTSTGSTMLNDTFSSTIKNLQSSSTDTDPNPAAAAATTTTTKSEIYINAEGKKVRRVMKQKNKDSSSSSVITDATVFSSNAAPNSPSRPLSGYFDQVSSMSPSTKVKRGSASVSGSTPSKTHAGEVYINAEGKKVRRVLKSKQQSEIVAGSGATTVADAGRGYGDASVTTEHQESSSLLSSTPTIPTKSNTIAEGEIYIRADGKKVRRVKRGSSNIAGSSATVAEPMSSSSATTMAPIRELRQPLPPPPADISPLSPLEGFLGKHSPKRDGKRAAITGSATVAGDRVIQKIDGGEIYINAQGKKVRRVRKAKPITSTTPTPTVTTALTPTEMTIANARTHLGVTQSILIERAAAKLQKAEMEYNKQQKEASKTETTTPTAIVETSRPSEEYLNSAPPTAPEPSINETGPATNDEAARIDSTASTNDTLDAPKLVSQQDANANNNDSDAAPEQLPNNDPTDQSLPNTNPPTTTDQQFTTKSNTTTTIPPLPVVTMEKSEIYINADGKKVRRIRRSSSNISTSSSVENGLPGSGTNRSIDSLSNPSSSITGENDTDTKTNFEKSNTKPQLGEIYIRPDGKKVRRVRRHQSTDSALALGMFLHDSGSNKPKLSGSATVVGDRKLDGEIIIRPDGKKVIRRAKSLMGTNTTTAAGELSATSKSTQQIGEIFRNADGKLVRRIKRTSSNNADAKSSLTKESSSVVGTDLKSPETSVDKNPVAQLTSDEEEIAKIYHKMKNMGIPEDAVRHKMAVSEVHPKIIAAVMGEEWNDPETAAALVKLQQSTPAGVSIELTSEEEVIADIYRKMQKMGLPQDAVRHKMIVNDISPKIVAAVLGKKWTDKESNESIVTDTVVEPKPQLPSIELTGGEEMIASLYRKLQKMGLTDEAVRYKMVTSNVHPKIIAAVLNEEWIDESKEDEVAPTDSNAPTLTAEEEETATPFRKMKKIGFSNDAVRHKMIMSDVHPKIMAAVLGEEWTDDSQPSTEPDIEVPNNLTTDDEAIVAQYKRMLKAGIPIESVRHKMTLENVDATIIAEVLGDDNNEPKQDAVMSSVRVGLTDKEEAIANQYRKMRRMGLPDDAIRHKMIVNEIDPKIITSFFNQEQIVDSNNEMSQPASVSTLPKASVAVAYVVVVGDEGDTEATVPAAASNVQFPISINPDEKFAVKVADETNPDSTAKETKFFTLDELARLSGQSKSELEAIVKEKRQRGLSPPKFSLQSLDEPRYEVSVPMPSRNITSVEDPALPSTSEKPISPPVHASNVTAIKEGQEVVDSDIAKAARAVSALDIGDMSQLLEKLKMGDMKDLLEKLYEAEKRQKKLEKQLAQAGVAIAEDIDYQEALNKVGEIAKRMNEIGGSDVVVADKAEQNRLREEYFKLEQEMERYNTALVLSEEYQAEQDRLELKWEADNEPLNIEALKKIRRHMPVNIRNLSEADLTTKASPNGKYLPVAIAKKFKRTNILQCLRLNPDDLECMHPATLENMRVTGLTLTERRALYIHFKPVGPKWEKNKAEKMTERKWTWYQMMRNNFKENVAPFQRHIDQYGGPDNHTCPLLGKQCPIRADKNPDYDGNYGWTEAAEFEVSDVRKADVEDSGAKAKAEALELTKAKKANERADLLKKHYKGKLLQVSKANGSCEGMDETMDQMESNTFRWTENMLDRGDNYTDVDKKKEVANFMDTLNELKLKVLAFAQRSGMQMSGKKTDGGDSTDIRSLVEGSLSEETYEASKELFVFIRMRLKKLDIVDTRCVKTIEMLEGYLNDLHGRNLALFESLGAKRMNRSRKLKTNKDIQKEVEERSKTAEPEPPPAEETPGRPGPPMGGGGRGGLMDAIAGRGRGGGGRGGLLDAISGRGRGRGGGGGRGGLLDAIAGRGRGGDKGGGGRGGLLDAIAGRGRGRGGDSAGGRGGLLDAIAGRGGGGGRGGLLAAIAARGGGGD